MAFNSFAQLYLVDLWAYWHAQRCGIPSEEVCFVQLCGSPFWLNDFETRAAL